MTRPIAAGTGLAALLAMMLTACAPVAIRGTIIEGSISMVAVVEPDDPRLSQPGVADASVVVRQTGRSGTVTERQSGEDGTFRVPLKGSGALSRPMAIEISADGYLSAVEPTMPTPNNSQRLLIVLQPMRQPTP